MRLCTTIAPALFTLGVAFAVARASEDKREPVPEASAQQQAEKSIKDLFKSDYANHAASTRDVLAQKLLANAATATDDPAGRYVLLREARDIAAAVGDTDTALSAAYSIETEYAVPPGDALLGAMTALRKVPLSPPAAMRLTIDGLDAIHLALVGDRVDIAMKIAQVLVAVAPRTGDAELVAAVRDWETDVRSADGDSRRVASDRKVLAEQPEDPKASASVGKYDCLSLGRWDEGVRLLIRSEDPKLRAASSADLAGKGDPASAERAAAAWAAVAATSHGVARDRILAHVCALYRLALPGLTGLEKVRASKLLAEAVAAARPWNEIPHETSSSEKGIDLGMANRNVGKQFLIQLEVNTTATGGVLLTKRHLPGDGSLTLSLQGNGAVDVTGDGSFYRVDLNGKMPINDGIWHTITVQKNATMVTLLVDHRFDGTVSTLMEFASASTWKLGWHGAWNGGALDAQYRRVWIVGWK